MLNNWINKKYLDEKNIVKIRKEYRKAKPYPHFALKDFFNKEKVEEVRKELLKESFEKIEKDLFSFKQTMDLVGSKNKIIQEFHQVISSLKFIDLIQKLTKESLKRKIDMQGHLFEDEDYLLFHDDVVEGRGVAYVVNFSKGFTKKDGGKLQLYDIKNPIKPIKEIIPEFNTLVAFTVSNKSLHAVEEVKNKKRLTIGGWIYGV